MDNASIGTESTPRTRRPKDGLSYKFQRLRERLRASVVGGELSGKLPGERTLARRFHVNAKTLSKALTDLAAEGLLDRSIGRGTYVKGAADTAPARAEHWMIVCENDRVDSALVRLFRQANPASTVIHDLTVIRPSFLRQFDAVIDLGLNTPEQFLRDLVVRNVPLIAVNRESDVFSVNTIGPDRAQGAASLTRDLVLAGHGEIAVVESLPRSVVGRTVRQTAVRYKPDAVVRTCIKEQVIATIEAGATAVICDAAAAGRDVRKILEAAGLRLPQDVSLAAVGSCDDAYPCSGQFADSRLIAKTVAEFLRGGPIHRPTALWLATHWVDQGTTTPVPRTLGGEAA